MTILHNIMTSFYINTFQSIISYSYYKKESDHYIVAYTSRFTG